MARDIIPPMKKTIVLPVLLALGFAVCVIAQSEADYSGWMKDVAATKGKVKKAMDSKSNTEVAENATHWAGLFKQVGAFWAGRNVSDALDGRALNFFACAPQHRFARNGPHP